MDIQASAVNGSARRAKVAIAVDTAMFLALLSLVFWVGKEAANVDALGVSLEQLRFQVAALAGSSTSADIAGIRARDDSQDRQLLDLKDYLGQRLDRLERKIDAKR